MNGKNIKTAMARPIANAVRPMKKKATPREVVDAGLDQPPAQHLHVFFVGFRVVLGGVFDEFADGLGAGILERAPVICSLLVVHDARGTLLDRAAYAHGRHQRERQRSGREKYQQRHKHGAAVIEQLPNTRGCCPLVRS